MFSLRLPVYHHKPGTALQTAPGPACDQCRRKKARCNRQQPCQGCKRGQISCSYDAVPKTRGRRPRVRSRTESSASPRSVKPSETMAWEAEQRKRTDNGKDGPLEVLDIESTTMTPPHPHKATETQNSTAVSRPEPECSLFQGLYEEDTSSDGTSPLALQRQATVESYLSEENFTPTYPRLGGSEAGVWAGSEEDLAGLLQSSLLLPPSAFIPYAHLFFDRLYPVFPVVDRECLLMMLSDGIEERPLPAGVYSFLAALSAAVIVQLNVADPGRPETQDSMLSDSSAKEHNDPAMISLQPASSAQLFRDQCLQARRQQDFIEEPDEWTVLTSFFLFAYHGNLNQSRSAWYYLREAIGFAQALRLDETDTYGGLDSKTAQRRRRLFWLLFITERAFAIQHRRRAILRPTIDLPRVFESQDPKLAYGFVTLAKLFAAADEAFVAAWRDQAEDNVTNTSPRSIQSITRFLRHNDVEGVLSELDETQRLDILITHNWLRVLVCQLHIRQSSHSIDISDGFNARCVLDTSRSLLQILSTASSISLESHGIGMEKNISDVATCLCDILTGLSAMEFSTDFFSAPDFLHNFMVFLAGFRNHESQYLGPLAQKATIALAARLHPLSFSASFEDQVADEEGLSYEDGNMYEL